MTPGPRWGLFNGVRARPRSSTCLWLAAALAWGVAGCGPRDREREVRIELADRLAVARVEGSATSAPDGAIVQGPGSVVTFALPLPERAALRGAAELRTADGAGTAAARVTLRTADGARRVLAEAPLSAGSLALDADLARHAGELVALDFAVEDAAGGGAAVTWRGLAVEGTERFAPAKRIAPVRANVLIVLLDSLRADHLSSYGAPDGATPNLARLASQGVTFAAARAPSSWTKPSVASLLTSRPPWGHGVVAQNRVLPARLPYLPEILGANGWRTVGISATAQFSAPYGFARGFGNLWDLWRAKDLEGITDPEARADWVWQHLIAPLAGGGAPFFAYLHELDPHSPYEPPPAYESDAARHYAGRRIPSSDDAIERMRRHPELYSAEEIAWLNEMYRGEVAEMDAYVGRLLERLDESGRARDTLVILLSDHGEEFRDHRSVGHAHTVYEELLRVPLLMRLPGVLPAGLRVTQPVDLLDVAPTVLELVGVPTPPAMLGRSLLPLVFGGSLPPRAILASSREPLRHSIAWGHWKLVRDDAGGGSLHLYDLTGDPGEQRDVAGEQPVVTEALRQLLAARLAAETVRTVVGRQGSEGLTPEAREQLRKLGYLE